MANYTTRPAKDRFLEKVKQAVDSECWLWTGATKPSGYGNFFMDGKYVSAHRAAYKIYKGSIAEGQVIMHVCDTPQCVNPDHLFAGTQAENIADMFSKGRGRPNPSNGERNPNARFTRREIDEIRSSSVPTKLLCKELGVRYQTVRNIRIGRTWKDAV